MGLNFKEVDSSMKWEHFVERSMASPIVIFKHSEICGTSLHAKEIMEEGGTHLDGTDVFIIRIQKNRPLSNDVATGSSVMHQSPQALLIDKGKCVYNASHYSINPKTIAEHLPT